MAFQINGEYFNLCNPYTGEHVWLWAGDTSNFDIPPDFLCSCGAIHWRNREHPENELDEEFKALEDASIYDYQKFEEQENNG